MRYLDQAMQYAAAACALIRYRRTLKRVSLLLGKRIVLFTGTMLPCRSVCGQQLVKSLETGHRIALYEFWAEFEWVQSTNVFHAWAQAK